MIGDRAGQASLLVALVAGGLVGVALGSPWAGSRLAVGLALAAALGTALARTRLIEHAGPRHVLDVSLPFAALLVLVLAVEAPLGLPGALHLLVEPLLAASLSLSWLALLALSGNPRRGTPAGLAAAALGALAALALVAGLGVAPVWVGLSLLATVLVAWRRIAGLEDPIHPGPGPLEPYVPWRRVDARPWPAWTRVPSRAPATLTYLVVSWILFIALGEPQAGGGWGLDTARYDALLFEAPDLSRATFEGLASLTTAPFLNHDHVQLVYVTVLLALFGVPFEVREGTRRAAGVFALAGVVGALVAGVLLHGLVAAWPDVAVVEEAWARTWSGGSVGAFGLMGALAARAQRPAPLFGFFVFWELNVGAWYLRSYTPAFHLTALVTGFLVARRLQPRQG